MNDVSILDHVPEGWELRPVQQKLLLEIEECFDRSDVVVVTAPTAAGKSLISITVARWQRAQGRRTNICAPQKILIGQLQKSFPEATVLLGKDDYNCTESDHDVLCRCRFESARNKAKSASIRLMNFWVYLANRLYAPTVIFDEGHQLIEMLHGLKDIELRQSYYKYPSSFKTVGDLIDWIQRRLETKEDEKLSDALRRIIQVDRRSIVVYKTKLWRGQSEVVLSVEDLSVAAATGGLWPKGAVQKIVLLSATTGPQDVVELGLADRRVTYLECESPIPPKQRPFVYQPAYNLARDSVRWGLPVLAKKVLELLERHPEKGLIHLPYSLAAQFKAICDHPRLLFHDNRNKAQVLRKFEESDPADGFVLVASGLYEGLDLPYDAARWQLIAKVPFQSLGEPRVAKKAELEPDYYAWDTIKKVIQAYGRIVRAPDDYGTTYLMDNSFGRLWREDKLKEKPMFPEFFRAAFKEVR